MPSPFNRQFRQSLYALKRQYPGRIEIYRLLSSVVNHQTGRPTLTTEMTAVHRAAVLPIRKRRETLKDVAGALGDGGRLDTSIQEFMIDREDVPSLPPLTEDDWIVHNGSKYQIKSQEDLPWDSGWMIVGERLDGEKFQRTIVCSADHFLVFTQSASGTDS